MISIEKAIEKAKTLPNISNGGSNCYDLEEAVLVKYTLPLRYLKPGYRARENQEKVLEAINLKASQGVNTPKHLGMLRTTEDDNDVCYVLQEKCKGTNCEKLSQYGVTYQEMMESLNIINNKIPFAHYLKLIQDCSQLFEMGYESKNKNLFYDPNSGFWFIDFLEYDKDNPFELNNPVKIFQLLKWICPKPIQIAARMSYGVKLTPQEEQEKNNVENSINSKFLLACKKSIPLFSRYEKFYLLDCSEQYKKYLMDNNIVEFDLLNLTEEDYTIFAELLNIVINNICKNVSEGTAPYWSVAANDIRNDSNLFNLQKFFIDSKFNSIEKDKYDDQYDFEYDSIKIYESKVMDLIIKKLKTMEQNSYITEFIKQYEEAKSKNKPY